MNPPRPEPAPAANRNPAPGWETRAAAARALGGWLETGAFPERLLDAPAGPGAFVMELVYGVCRQRRALEWLLGRLAPRRPDRRALPFLLVGLYQAFGLDDVADYAAVAATVEALKRERGGWAPTAVRFANAVLRAAWARRDELRAALAAQPTAVRLSHPDILVSRWTARLGRARAEALCAWNNTRPAVVLRIPGRGAAGYAHTLAATGIAAAPHPAAPDECLTLPHGVRVADLPGYAEGVCTVQDPSTLHAVRLLDPQPGDRVLDACAAPGGKAIAIAERVGPDGTVWAVDASARRLARLRANAARLRAANVRIVAADATRDDLAAACGGAPFDRILLDVPCTNTGVLRRRPDARWRFTAASLAAAAHTQRALLDHAAAFVRPGGRLVYSTCSLEPEENEDQVAAWLDAHAEFFLADAVATVPPDAGTDGAYAAALDRRQA